LEVTDHDFGIDKVFSAAKRDESDFDHELGGGASYRREADRRGSVIWGNRIGGLRQGATD
jgi:hypothetical protein